MSLFEVETILHKRINRRTRTSSLIQAKSSTRSNGKDTLRVNPLGNREKIYDQFSTCSTNTNKCTGINKEVIPMNSMRIAQSKTNRISWQTANKLYTNNK